MASGIFKDLTDMQFERLTVVSRDHTRKGTAYWWCSCDCNNELLKISVSSSCLTRGRTKSCGCLKIEKLYQYNLKVVRKENEYDLSGDYGIGYTSKGEAFYFDLEDYDKIKTYYWGINTHGYVVFCREEEDVYMHRLVMDVTDKNLEPDHIYHINYDNRKEHLRIVTSSQNNMNRAIFKNNTSGVTGVVWNKRDNYWVVTIQKYKKNKYIGSFHDFDDAVKARKEAEEKYFGEFSYDNSMILNKDNKIQEQNDSLGI